MNLFFLIAGAVITAITAVIQYYDNQENEKITKSREIDLNKKIDTLSENNRELLKEITQLSKDNSKLSTKLTNTAIQLNTNSIGSGNPEIKVVFKNDTNFNFILHNYDNLPIFNASVAITNIEKLKNCVPLSESKKEICFSKECFYNSHIRINGYNINSNSNLLLEELVNTEGREIMHFQIVVVSRKQYLLCQFLLYKKGNEWYTANRKFVIKNSKRILLEDKSGREPKYWSNIFFNNKRINYYTKD